MDPVITAPEYQVELQPLFDLIFNILAVTIPPILLGVVGYVSKKWLNIRLEDTHRAALEGALMKGSAWALGKARESTSKIDIATKNAAIAMAANYVLASTPAALTHFGISPDRLKELVEARVAEILLDKNKDITAPEG